jgi:hypothetical protein
VTTNDELARRGASVLPRGNSRATLYEIDALNSRGDTLRARLVAAGLEVTGQGSRLRVFPEDPDKAWWALYRRACSCPSTA